MVRAARWCMYGVIAVCLSVSLIAQGQKDVANKQQVVDQMRLLYYTPTTAGLRSFTCGVEVNWQEIFQHASAGKTVAADDPRVLYLNKAKIAYTGYLDGKSDIEWTLPSDKYPGGTAALWQMRDGMTKMLTGFTKLWSTFLGGSFLPSSQDQYHLTQTLGGYVLSLSQANVLLVERLNREHVITEYHVRIPGVDLDLHTSFEKSPYGMVFTGYDGAYDAVSSAASAVPTHLEAQVTYQKVGGYQIVSTLQMQVTNAGQFDFTFTGCQVNQDAAVGTQGAPAKVK